MARKTRFTSTMSPGQITLPGVGKDPGVKAKFKSLTLQRRVDPRGDAMGVKAQAKGAYADTQRSLADRTRQSGTIISEAMQNYANETSKLGTTVEQSGVVMANAQEMFGRSFATLARGFTDLGEMLKPKQNELAVAKAAFNVERASLDFESEEVKNPNPKKLSGKPFLDDYDERHTKAVDTAIQGTQDELGYTFDTETSEKVQALALRARIQGLERAAGREQTRHVTTIIQSVDEDIQRDVIKKVQEDGDIGAGIARGELIAERLNGVASPEKYLSVKEGVRIAALEGGIRHHLDKGDVGRAKAIYQTYTGYAGESATANVRLLIDAANGRGLPPEFLVAAGYIETAGTYSAKIKPLDKSGKPLSSAAGLGQLTGPMAKAYLGVSDASLASPGQQAEGWARYTEDHYRGLKRFLGRPPSYGELMLAQYVGFGKAGRILQAVFQGKGATPLNKFLSAEEIKNVGLKGAVTAEEALVTVETRFQGALQKVYDLGIMEGKELPADAAALPIDEVHRRVGGLIEAYETNERKERDDSELKAETSKMATDLWFTKQLTMQWLQANREHMTPSDYRMFTKALLSPADYRKTEPEEYLRLDALADTDPVAAKEELKDLWLADGIASADFHRLYNKAHNESDPLKGNPVKREIRGLIRGHLAPSRDLKGQLNKNEYNRQFEAGAAFDDWAAAHPSATREELYDAGQQIIKFFGNAKYTATTSLLVPPKYISKPKTEITIEDVNASSLKIAGDLQAKRITGEEASRLQKINKSWLEVLQYRESKKK